MTTQVAHATTAKRRNSRDRQSYLLLALAAEAVIFAGFSRSYYLRSYLPGSARLSLLVSIHGLLFTAWMVYFIAQTALITLKRPALHRKLGLFGAFLGSAVIVMGLLSLSPACGWGMVR